MESYSLLVAALYVFFLDQEYGLSYLVMYDVLADQEYGGFKRVPELGMTV